MREEIVLNGVKVSLYISPQMNLFEKILQRAGTKPRSLTSDVGPEFQGDFARMLDSKGIISFQKRPEDKNAIATLDVAIGQLKKQLVRDTRRLGTNDWASRLSKVTDGKAKTRLRII